MTLGLRFVEFGQRLVGIQGEALASFEFRHQIVVVGVEPLGHFQRMQIMASALVAAGHREIAVQMIFIEYRSVARWYGVEQHGGIQHVVIQAEVVARHHIGAGIHRQLPVSSPQHRGRVE
jgi:hypothetical protein